MKNYKNGFIQIPLLIAIISGVVFGSGGYLGYKQYQSYQIEKIEKEKIVQEEGKETQILAETQQKALEKAQVEIEKLKNESIATKQKQQVLEKTNTSSKRILLSNTQVVSKIKPATVFIETTEGSGSGMILDSSGYILTNAHVLWDVSVAKIKLSDGRMLSAEVVGRDEIIDLAILKIVGINFSYVVLGNSDNIEQGDDVFTLGYPFGLEGDVSFKEGTISRRISDGDATYLETSAEIHPGNSGGPLVNKYGEVVGINTASYGQTIEGVTVGETIKLAIPINVAKNLIPEMKAGRNIVIDHTQYESQPSNGSDVAMEFMMKTQCASYQSKIENDIADLNYYSKTKAKTGAGMTTIFGEIFYSPVTNSCLYTETVYMDLSWMIGKEIAYTSPGLTTEYHTSVVYRITDILEDSTVYTTTLNPGEWATVLSGSPKATEFHNKVDYYKGE